MPSSLTRDAAASWASGIARFSSDSDDDEEDEDYQEPSANVPSSKPECDTNDSTVDYLSVLATAAKDIFMYILLKKAICGGGGAPFAMPNYGSLVETTALNSSNSPRYARTKFSMG
ncbi:hypothetical protein BLNAU_4747 [Blattamonas nauphoetae]|uniref:Uncharacterized protein n=1 Tax=Blattamonas nauphoetae TaxID=2049346 RepID=A0ABQ9Y933_9EUKA|nr:hypothetical protein BLNAU_4747 [Blattamonas nauphoetae]